MPLEKIVSSSQLAAAAQTLAARGKKLVFTNGCFDLLHVGHVRYLQAARKLGDALAIALNSDASVRALKGENRPITSEQDRAEVLSALECVDFVTIFPDERVTNLAREVRPQIYVKGGDYTVDTLNREERTALEEAGAEIKILPLVPGKSTTGVIEKMKQATDAHG